jgi:multimeric flavodoxin WrbA
VHSQRAQDKELLRINKTANNQSIVQGKPTKHIVSEKQREITQRANRPARKTTRNHSKSKRPAQQALTIARVQARVLHITTDQISKTSQEWRHKT